MASAIRNRPRIGDVVEIATPRGLAYAQFTHQHDAPPKFGAVIRVAPGFHGVRPASFSEIVALRPQFITFFPLGAACNRGFVSIVANESVPDHAAAFPTFRSGIRGRDGIVKIWWLWDGTNERRVGKLTQATRLLPIRAIWNDTLLVERIVSEWRSEDVT